MNQKNGNSLHRHGTAMLRESLEIVAQIEAGKQVIGELAANTIKSEFKSAARARFDALQVGDSLQSFGICALVAKKNAKSVVTTTGSRWTLTELGAE